MSYYFHSYLICNEETKNIITGSHFDDYFDDLDGYYDDFIYKLDKNKYLVIFDTRSHECSTSFIEKFIKDNTNTIWYSVDEELAYQRKFSFKENRVVKEVRKIFCPIGDYYIFISFEEEVSNRPLLTYTLFPNKIVIDNILSNGTYEYPLDNSKIKEIDDYIYNLVDSKSNVVQYLIPHIENIKIDISIHYDNESFYISSIDKEDKFNDSNSDNGIELYENIINFINKLISDEDKRFLLTEPNNVLKSIMNTYFNL